MPKPMVKVAIALARHLAHAGHDGAGVDAAREEHAERHVALQAQPYGLPQRLAHLRRGLGRPMARGRQAIAGRQRPVPGQRQPPVGQDRVVAGRQFLDLGVDRPYGRRVPEGEVVAQGFPVDACERPHLGQQGFRLRGEEQEPVAMPVEQRLLAQAVAGQDQPPTLAIPEREGEHSRAVARHRRRPRSGTIPGSPRCRWWCGRCSLAPAARRGAPGSCRSPR